MPNGELDSAFQLVLLETSSGTKSATGFTETTFQTDILETSPAVTTGTVQFDGNLNTIITGTIAIQNNIFDFDANFFTSFYDRTIGKKVANAELPVERIRRPKNNFRWS